MYLFGRRLSFIRACVPIPRKRSSLRCSPLRSSAKPILAIHATPPQHTQSRLDSYENLEINIFGLMPLRSPSYSFPALLQDFLFFPKGLMPLPFFDSTRPPPHFFRGYFLGGVPDFGRRFFYALSPSLSNRCRRWSLFCSFFFHIFRAPAEPLILSCRRT